MLKYLDSSLVDEHSEVPYDSIKSNIMHTDHEGLVLVLHEWADLRFIRRMHKEVIGVSPIRERHGFYAQIRGDRIIGLYVTELRYPEGDLSKSYSSYKALLEQAGLW